jgi:hypothetical protein
MNTSRDVNILRLFMLSYYVFFLSLFYVAMSVLISTYKRYSFRPVVCGRDHVLFTLLVVFFVWWCVVFVVVLFDFVLCFVYILSFPLYCPLFNYPFGVF